MTTLAQLRKAALAYPETAEHRVNAVVAFTVRDKRFAALGPDKQVELRVHAPADFLAAHPTGQRLPDGVRIPIADINGQQLNH